MHHIGEPPNINWAKELDEKTSDHFDGKLKRWARDSEESMSDIRKRLERKLNNGRRKRKVNKGNSTQN